MKLLAPGLLVLALATSSVMAKPARPATHRYVMLQRIMIGLTPAKGEALVWDSAKVARHDNQIETDVIVIVMGEETITRRRLSISCADGSISPITATRLRRDGKPVSGSESSPKAEFTQIEQWLYKDFADALCKGLGTEILAKRPAFSTLGEAAQNADDFFAHPPPPPLIVPARP